MKFKNIGWVMFFLVLACHKSPIPSTESNQPEKEKIEQPKENVLDNTKAISAFFLQSLSNVSSQVTLYVQNEPLTLTEIEKAQQEVWNLYKQANQQFIEDRLVSLNQYTKTPYRWQLPLSDGGFTTMPYYYGSIGNKPQNGYPLYVYLHGSGPKQSEWDAGFQIGGDHKEIPSVRFVPQIPDETRYRWWQKEKQIAWERLLRQSFLSGQIDANKIYFFGVSEGGYGSQRLASFYADYLAGAGPMAGGEPLINAPVENYRNIGFEFITGELDYMFHRATLTQYTNEALNALQQNDPQGYVHNIEIEKGSGHGVIYKKMLPRLKKYERNPYPKKMVWEDFEMDEVHRKGFYNLVVNERPAQRVRYTMNIVGNTIDIKAEQVSYTAIEISDIWNFPMKYRKSYTPVKQGKWTLYLNEHLVDFNQPIVVRLNNQEVYRAEVQPDKKHIVNSCAVFFDPYRLYPVGIEISIK